MDPALGAAAHALSAFDPLGALKRIALRDDPNALALRGIAMAQLGDYGIARKLLGRAARAFEKNNPLARARCLAAQGEVALADRDLVAAGRALDAAAIELDTYGDRLNALFIRLQGVRRLVLLGALSEASHALGTLHLQNAPPRLRAIAAIIGADIAVRQLDARSARTSIARARENARAAGIASLFDEVERAARDLDAPVARLVREKIERPVLLDEVAELARSKELVIDACRRTIRRGGDVRSLVTRPVLLGLAILLGRAGPEGATREALADEAFGARRVTESTRARLRVEVGRLRRVIASLAVIEATEAGYAIRARSARIVVLLPPAPGEASALLALLRGGESWSTSALAAAIGSSQRTVQRALVALRDEGRVEGLGRGRAQRWIARPPEGFATTLLLVTRAPTV